MKRNIEWELKIRKAKCTGIMKRRETKILVENRKEKMHRAVAEKII
jgi:hypothetical protein